MKSVFVTSLLCVLLAGSVQASTSASTLQCLLNIVENMQQAQADPVDAALSFSICAGDQTWAYAAPFIGGAIRPLISFARTKMTAPTLTER